LPKSIISTWKLKNGKYLVKDQLNGTSTFELNVEQGIGIIKLKIDPLESFILNVEREI
jgi:hypothetical protein